VSPKAAVLIEGGLGQQVAGLGAYSMWNQTLDAEIAAYRTADKALSIFRAGTDKSTDAILDGSAPYWRLALQHVWSEGMQSAMIGTYGINARKFPDSLDPMGPSTYYYGTKYGGTLAYFRTTGDSDDRLYNTGQAVTGSANGNPKSSGYIFELNWLPRRDMRLMLQYTAYQDFNGARTNYDGFGRNAKDNNTLFLMGWLMF
jgi:hypothetical protein